AGFRGVGFSKFISYGNALNVDEVDLLEYLGNDKKTRVICMYIEGTRRGKELMKVAQKVSCKKPIVAIKAGRSEEGGRAVSSHTGAMAGSSMVWDAAFKQSGIVKAEDVEEMFDYARIFNEEPLPKGNKVAIATNGGGFGVLATDMCVANGLELAELSQKTKKKIKESLHYFASANNPIDMAAEAGVEQYEAVLNALVDDKNVHSIFCIALFQPVAMDSEVVDIIVEAHERSEKPLIVCSAGGEYNHVHMKTLEENGVPTYDKLSSAAKALGALTYYEKFKKGHSYK
ncbi:MAG: CoA-binding protein, partial [Candidatus Diapherotrites archaeon]|nr:CoA-binding protein [Candidatus Diapherotrites archaeon]